MLPPILANYYVTYRCNARCDFCDIWRTKKYRHIEDAQMQDVKNNLSALKKLGVRFVDFTGGEPLLHRQLPEMLEYAKHLGLRTSITTNCLLYSQRAVDTRGLVDFLHFSLDSVSRATHDRLRGVCCFDSVMTSIETAENLGETPDLLFTVTEENWTEIGEMVAFAQKRGLVLIVNPIFSHEQNHNLQLSVLQHLEKFAGEPFVYINRAFHRLRRNGGNDVQAPRCRAVSSTVVISPDNQMLLPCFHHATISVPIKDDLLQLRKSAITRKHLNLQGRFQFCSGCAINCYFDPSFHYKLDAYFFESIIAKSKYWFDKKIRAVIVKATQNSNIRLT